MNLRVPGCQTLLPPPIQVRASYPHKYVDKPVLVLVNTGH